MIYKSTGNDCLRTRTFILEKLSKVHIGLQVYSEFDAKNDLKYTQIETIDLLIYMIQKYKLQPPSEIMFNRVSQFYECIEKCGEVLQSSSISMCLKYGCQYNTQQEIELFFSPVSTSKYNDYLFKDIRIEGDGVTDIKIRLIPRSVENLQLDLVRVDSVLLTTTFELKSLHFVAIGGGQDNIEVFCNLLPNSIRNLYLDLSYCLTDELLIDFPINVEQLSFKLNHEIAFPYFDVSTLKNLHCLSLENIDIADISYLKFPKSLTRLFLKNANMDEFTRIDELKYIEELSIKEGYLNGGFLFRVEKLKNLREFQYKEVKLDLSSTKTIRNDASIYIPPKLEFLELKSHHLHIESLDFHDSLKFLTLEDVSIEKSKLSLVNAPNLIEALIENTNIKHIQGFENCTQLEFLKFNGVPVFLYRDISNLETNKKDYLRMVNRSLELLQLSGIN